MNRCTTPAALRALMAGAPSRVTILLLMSAAALSAQEPPDSLPPAPADTTTVQPVPDSVQVPDSLAVDSAGVVPDSLAVDSAGVEVVMTDTLPLPIMPAAPRGEALGWANQVWQWDRDDLRSTRAFDLTELLLSVPGAVPLRGGDYGTPRSVSTMATGPGRIRVFWDGFELSPVEGGVADLTRIPLSGLERVRAERTGGDLRVEVWSLEQSDQRPYSLIETGTGDLDTNLFRGTFGHPRVLGGKLHVSLDRLDTGGTNRMQPGSSTGFWLSYSLEPSERWGIRAEMRRMSSERDTLFAPGKATRSDWVVRARAEPWRDVVAEVFAGRSWITKSEADSLVAFTEAERDQYGLRFGVEKPAWWAAGSARLQSGDGVPGSVTELRGGLRTGLVGGLEATWTGEGWSNRSTSSVSLRAWTRSYFGLSGFASYQDGSRGVPFVMPPPPDTNPGDEGGEGEPAAGAEAADLERFTERTSSRIGAQIEWRGLRLSGARLRVQADSLHPLGLPTDAEGVVVPGGTRTGWEISTTIPLWPRGLAIRGHAARWDPAEALRYLPQRTWEGALDFNRVFLPSRNLEFFVTLGMRGRDPMVVPILDDGSTEEDPVLATVPWEQTVYARLQIRVMTFRIFVTADNLAQRTDNQDYPGRFLPNQRIITGVRWTLWN